MKLQTLQILQFFIVCRNMVGGASVHIAKHSLFRLKITVGCRLCIVWCGVVCVVCVCVDMIVRMCMCMCTCVVCSVGGVWCGAAWHAENPRV